MNRKEFLKKSCIIAAGLGLYQLGAEKFMKGAYSAGFAPYRKEALYYKKIDENTVQCELCPRRCTLANGQRSFCRVREPKDGTLYSLCYGIACAVHVDPIEKKPLFHFLPGTTAFSIATAGCNFRCKFCQNWSISQATPEEAGGENIVPDDVVKGAISSRSRTIAYTYTDPAIFYEYMLDSAVIARAHGVKNMFHSNGSLNPQPAAQIAQYLDAANVDLKAFNQDFYSQVCAGYLDTVLETLRILKKNNVWVEITNLVVPGMNDDMNQVRQMSEWIRDNIGKETPVHFSRFWPQYKMTSLAPTPVSTLEEARGTAMASGLEYVYIGNVPNHKAESTYCPKCKKRLVQRLGYTVLENNINEGNCRFCGYPIAGVWS